MRITNLQYTYVQINDTKCVNRNAAFTTSTPFKKKENHKYFISTQSWVFDLGSPGMGCTQRYRCRGIRTLTGRFFECPCARNGV